MPLDNSAITVFACYLSGSTDAYLLLFPRSPPAGASSFDSSRAMPESLSNNTELDHRQSVQLPATEIIFVNSASANVDEALESILAASSSDGIDVVFLDMENNGVEVISRVLADRMGYKTAHIVSNGGQLQLGNVYLCDANIASYARRIASWQMALASDAQICIHGCELEAKASECLVEDLGVLTSARVVMHSDD